MPCRRSDIPRSPISHRMAQGSRFTTNSMRLHTSACSMQADGTDWREVSQLVLRIDPDREPDRARRAFDGHLAQAKWAAGAGYKQLLQRG